MRTVRCQRCGNTWFDAGSENRERMRFYQCHRCGAITAVKPRLGQLSLQAFSAKPQQIQQIAVESPLVREGHPHPTHPMPGPPKGGPGPTHYFFVV